MPVLISNCPLCEASELREMFRARDLHYGIQGEFRLVRCEGCSLAFMNPMYNDQELALLYPSDYYAYQDHASFSDGIKARIKEFLGMNWQSRDPIFQQPGTMLDVGCGSGWFIKAMREKGWEVRGVEINQGAASIGRDRYGLDIVTGTLEQAAFPGDFFHYVRLNHSFEHMTNPSEVLREVRRVLKPGGKVMIGVPNFASIPAKAFGKYWWQLAAPVHAFHYSPATLTALLSRHGFKVEKVRFNSELLGMIGSYTFWKQQWQNDGGRLTDAQQRFTRNKLAAFAAHIVAKCFDLIHLGDSMEITSTK